MSASKMPAGPENHPDEYEHRLPAGGARKVEDGLLADLARRLAPTRGLPQAKAISARNGRGEDPIQPRNGGGCIRRLLSFRADRPPATLGRAEPSGSALAVRTIRVTAVLRWLGAQEAGQRRVRHSRSPAALRCLALRWSFRFSGPKQARQERSLSSSEVRAPRQCGRAARQSQFKVTSMRPGRVTSRSQTSSG